MAFESLPKSKFGLRVSTKYTGLVRPPRLDNGQMTKIGREMVAAQKKRWADAVDASGNPAKRLSMKYLFEKKKFTHTSRPLRDMKMTGRTIANFQLRKALDSTIRAENTTRLERSKARRAQVAGNMIGFSPTDQITVFRSVNREYGEWATRAWVKIR
jgi:hypothetical protein